MQSLGKHSRDGQTPGADIRSRVCASQAFKGQCWGMVPGTGRVVAVAGAVASCIPAMAQLGRSQGASQWLSPARRQGTEVSFPPKQDVEGQMDSIQHHLLLDLLIKRMCIKSGCISTKTHLSVLITFFVVSCT